MPADALVAKFGGKKRPPKFADEGPPDMEDSPRGGGAGVDAPDVDEPDADDVGGPPDGDDDDMPGDMPGGGDADPEGKAVDDMSDILGVGPEDRQDFANALQAYVHACVEKALAPEPGSMPPTGGGDMPMPDDSEGPPPDEGY